jgi:hypothetical protein
MDVEGIDNVKKRLVKMDQTMDGEENRQIGDLLNKYLYLSGRVNMREVEMTTQHLISDGLTLEEILKFRVQVFRSLRHMFLIIEWPKWLRNMEITV